MFLISSMIFVHKLYKKMYSITIENCFCCTEDLRAPLQPLQYQIAEHLHLDQDAGIQYPPFLGYQRLTSTVCGGIFDIERHIAFMDTVGMI